VLPVAAVIAVLFAFNYKNKKTVNNDPIIKSDFRITLVVDAGHGGVDPGAKSPDGKYTEAQIALDVSKRIRDLSGEYNINAIMTREDDVLPGNAKNITDALKRE
jgi:N-acetylmuramoyl-L-alanine amidase